MSILDQINPLPEGFLKARRPSLEAAHRKVFLGTVEAIPEVPAWPGIWTPFVKPAPPAPRSHHQAKTSHSRTKATGEIPVGTIVPTFYGNGTVLGYICAGDDPMAVVPPGTPTWQLSGARTHESSNINRYVIRTARNNHDWYLFQKAVILETQMKGIK